MIRIHMHLVEDGMVALLKGTVVMVGSRSDDEWTLRIWTGAPPVGPTAG